MSKFLAFSINFTNACISAAHTCVKIYTCSHLALSSQNAQCFNITIPAQLFLQKWSLIAVFRSAHPACASGITHERQPTFLGHGFIGYPKGRNVERALGFSLTGTVSTSPNLAKARARRASNDCCATRSLLS